MKTIETLWHYYRDKIFLNANGTIANFPANNNNSDSFKFKTKIAGTTGNGGAKNAKIRVPLKHSTNFWRNFEMPLINCEIILILTWSNRCFIIEMFYHIAGQEPAFTITDTKLYVPIVTLSSEDNAKLLGKLKSGFKRTINCNKYEPIVPVQEQNQYIDSLVNPSFQVVNRLFVLSFQNNGGRTSYARYYLQLVEAKNCNFLIDGRNYFDQIVKMI